MSETFVGRGVAATGDPVRDPAAAHHASWKRDAVFGAIAGLFAAPITATLLLGLAEMARRSQVLPAPHSPWTEIARALILGLIPGYGLSQVAGASLPSVAKVALSSIANAIAYAALMMALGRGGARQGRVWIPAVGGYLASAALAAFTLLRG